MSTTLIGFARALGGALLFAMPLLMTMELWQLAVSLERWRLVVLVVATAVLTLGLARTFGAVRGGVSWREAAVDAAVAVLAGVLAALVVLAALSIVDPIDGWTSGASIVALEALPGSLGAAFARSQLGQERGDRQLSGYVHQLFLMAAGAVVFAANIAPTEEVVLLAAEITPWHAMALVLLSLALMHAFVYGVGFRGQEEREGPSFLALTVPGYLIAVALSAFMLWTFGRFADTGAVFALRESVVLALPASLGAAAARLIL